MLSEDLKPGDRFQLIEPFPHWYQDWVQAWTNERSSPRDERTVYVVVEDTLPDYGPIVFVKEGDPIEKYTHVPLGSFPPYRRCW